MLRSKEAAAMIRSLFLSMQELNKGARRPADVPPSKVKKVAVLGAGFMGASVAYVTAEGRHRCGADRSRSGKRRQGQGHAKTVIDGRIKPRAARSRTRRSRCSRA
jgi:3-hydroxyacyl-CoA dehydrogenase/enoyl-CoA hydratase/3-hydroxybutyryl-CoA epimerase